MIVRDDPASPWKRLVGEPDAADDSNHVDGSQESSTIGVKRALSPSDSDVPGAKRARGISQASTRQSSSCLAPKPNLVAQSIIANQETAAETSLGTGDVFLTENFRERWCRCASVCIHIFIHTQSHAEPPSSVYRCSKQTLT